MVLIGLLLLALICLALGLVLTSSAWLIASLIASAGAGLLLWRTGSSLAAKPAHPVKADEKKAAGDDSEAADTSAAAKDSEAPPTTAHPAAAAAPAAQEVWVIDGRPRYHLADCAIIKGQEAEPIPYPQATEDGFMPCSLCEPNAARAGTS